MKKYNNSTNISLSVAVHLATDDYDHNDDPNHISATSLIKSTKKIILASRVPPEDNIPDIASLIKAQSGTAIHNAIEKAWLTNHEQAMLDLGYPQHIVDRVRVNPTERDFKWFSEHCEDSMIPIYMEKRSVKEIEGMKVSGKFDFVCEGKLEDFKNTSVYSYINKSNDKDYILQGSIYRWLNPDIITSDFITIQYQFWDWSAVGALRDPKNYPPQMQMPYRLPLMSIPETEAYVRNKILEIKKYWNAKEEDMPICTKEDLWQNDSVFKYYKNPTKTNRSTANFTNIVDATARLQKDGGVGVVKEIKAKAKACDYCNAYPICKQKNNYIIK